MSISTPPPPQRHVFVVISVRNEDTGTAATAAPTITVPAGTNSADLLAYVLANSIPEDARGGVVVHFSVHPAVIA
jgi:hypothetical protein